MILSCRPQTAGHFRFVLSWFVSQSGSLPPRFSSLIRLNLTSESRYLSKRHDRSTDNSWFQPNGQPISPVPQKWRNCEGKISGRIKTLGRQQEKIAKMSSCDSARRQNYPFWVSEKSLARAM